MATRFAQDLIEYIRPFVLRWAAPRLLPFSTFGSISPITIGVDPFGVTIDRDMVIRWWTQSVNVQTTNNGSNYWTIDLRSLGAGTLASLNTSAIAAGVWANLSNKAINTSAATTDIGLYIRVAKVGSPGSLYLLSPAVFVD